LAGSGGSDTRLKGAAGMHVEGGLAIAAPHGGGGKGGPGAGGARPAQQRRVRVAASDVEQGRGREREGAAGWLACGPAQECGAQPQGERGKSERG
jgi:hypothetical protein